MFSMTLCFRCVNRSVRFGVPYMERHTTVIERAVTGVDPDGGREHGETYLSARRGPPPRWAVRSALGAMGKGWLDRYRDFPIRPLLTWEISRDGPQLDEAGRPRGREKL